MSGETGPASVNQPRAQIGKCAASSGRQEPMQVEHRDPEGSHNASGNCGFPLRERDSLPPRFIAPCDPHVPAWVVVKRGMWLSPLLSHATSTVVTAI